MKTRHTREVVEIVLIVALLLGAFVFIRPKMTGMVVGETDKTTLDINYVFNESHEGSLNLEGNITSLAVSGSYSGDKVEIYLDDMLVYSSESKEYNKITGNVIGSNVSQNSRAENTTENIQENTDAVNQSQNTNDTSPVSENINQTCQNITKNISAQNATQLNLTSNETQTISITNQTTNTTKNISSEHSEIPTKIIPTVFSNECEETCLLENYPSNITYKLIIENATLNLSSITYSYIKEADSENVSVAQNMTVNQTSELNVSQNITINATGLNVSRNITYNEFNHTPVRVGKPVQWSKKVRYVRAVMLPNQAYNISVIKKLETSPADKPVLKKEVKKIRTRGRQKIIEIADTSEELEITYITPGPKKSEKKINHYRKQVTISSEIHYKNVLASTKIEEAPQESIKVYWLVNDTKKEVKEVKYIDSNNNNLIDMLEWTVPHLSNQTYEISIEILNIQSYPTVGGNWTVLFNTTGRANLTIKGINGTTISHDSIDDDLNLLYIKCGKISKDYVWKNNSVFVENYECNQTSSETSKVITTGKHYLEFTFGNMSKIARNKASAITTYTMSDYSSKGHKAYEKNLTPSSPTDYDSEAGSSDYTAIDSDDASYWETSLANGNNEYDSQIYHFNISENISDITVLNVTWIGKSSEERNGYDLSTYIWNNSGDDWVQLNSDSNGSSTDVEFNSAVINSTSDFINVSGVNKWVYIYATSKLYRDEVPPNITQTDPSDGETDVGVAKDVIIYFSEPMDTSTVTYSSSPNPGGWSNSWNAQNTTLTASHSDFSNGQSYDFEVTAGKDVAGNDLVAGAASNPFSFTTVSGGCPFLYAWDGKNYSFVDATISSAFLKRYEETTYDWIHNIKPRNNSYELVLAGSLEDIWFINDLNLIAVDHPDDTIVLPDSKGNFHTLKNTKPASVFDEKGNNISRIFEDQDTVYWESNLNWSTQDVMDYLYIEVPEEHQDTIKLVVDVRSTELSDMKLWYVLHNILGSKNNDFVIKLIEHTPLFKLSFDINSYLTAGFIVQYHDGKNWKDYDPMDTLPSYSAYFNRTIVIPLNVSKNQADRIRLKLPVGMHQIDYLGVDTSDQENIQVHNLSLTKAHLYSESGTKVNVLQNVSRKDDNYAFMKQGEYIKYDFAANLTKPDVKRSYFGTVGGYYYVKGPTSEKNNLLNLPVWLKVVLIPHEFARYSLPIYTSKDYKQEFVPAQKLPDFLEKPEPSQGKKHNTLYTNYIELKVHYEYETPAPQVERPTFSPSIAYPGTNIKCNTTVTDSDNQTGLRVEYMWYNLTESGYNFILGGNKTGVNNNTNIVATTLGRGNTTLDETWNCSVRAFDGSNYGGWRSSTITIQDYVQPEFYNCTDNASEINVSDNVKFTAYWNNSDEEMLHRLLISNRFNNFTDCNYTVQTGCLAYSSPDTTSPTEAIYTAQSGDRNVRWYAQICTEYGDCKTGTEQQSTVESISNSNATAYSFQRKTWNDGSKYWTSFYNGSHILFYYKENETSWSENPDARLSASSSDFSVFADSSRAYIAYKNNYDIITRAAENDNWWNSSWLKRRKISFDNSDQSENLVNFTVLIKLNSSRIDYSKLKDSGADIRFVDEDNITQLSYEIEHWNESKNSFIWVKVPQIDSSSNSDYIWMYYNNDDADSAENASSTWDSNYMMVHHFNGSSLPGDSTSNNNDVVANNGAAYTATSGLLGSPAYDYERDDSNDYMDIDYDSTLDVLDQNDPFTLEAYIKGETWDTSIFRTDTVWQQKDGGGTGRTWLSVKGPSGSSSSAPVEVVLPSSQTSNSNVDTGKWYYLTVGYDGTNMNIYINGILDDSAGRTPDENADGDYMIGQHKGGDNEWDGIIDELRISDTNRSLAWLKVNNMSLTDSFASYGEEEGYYPGERFTWEENNTVYDGSSESDQFKHSTVTRDTNGKIWISATHQTSTSYMFKTIQSSNSDSLTSWQSATTLDTSTSNIYGTNTPMSNGKMYGVWINSTKIYGKNYSSDWNDDATYIGEGKQKTNHSLSTVSNLTTLHIAYINTNGNLKYRNYDGTSWGAEVNLDSSSSNRDPSLIIDNSTHEVNLVWSKNNDILFKRGYPPYTYSYWESPAHTFTESGTNVFTTTDDISLDQNAFASWTTSSSVDFWEFDYESGTFTVLEAPNITQPRLRPAIIYSNNDTTANTTYNGLDGGSVHFQWYIDSQNVWNDTATDLYDGEVAQSTLDSINYTKDQYINVSVYANYTTGSSQTQWSETQLIQNSPPTISEPVYSPELTYSVENVVCNATSWDAENSTLTIEYKWFNCTSDCTEFSGGSVGGKTEGITQMIAELNSENTSIGDMWNCSVRSFDGENHSVWRSSQVEILNSPPQWSDTLTIYSIYHNINMSLQLNATDADGQILNWNVNDSIVNINQSGYLFDDPQMSDTGNHSIMVNVSDSTNTTFMNFTYEIKNDNPDINNIILDPSSPHEDNDILCNATPTDNENSTLSIEYQWLNCTTLPCSTVVSGTTDNLADGSTALVSTLDSNNISKDELWNCSVRSFDGLSYSQWKSDQVSVIENNVPSVYDIQLDSKISNTTIMNISSNITDIHGVSEAIAAVKYPNGTIWKNITLIKVSDSDRWINDTVHAPVSHPWGNYTVQFIATDSFGKVNATENIEFILYPLIEQPGVNITIDGNFNDWNLTPAVWDEREGNDIDILNISVANNASHLFFRAYTNNSISSEIYRVFISTNGSTGNLTSPDSLSLLPFKYDYMLETKNSECSLYNFTQSKVSNCSSEINESQIELSVAIEDLELSGLDNINITLEAISENSSMTEGEEYTSDQGWNKTFDFGNMDEAFSVHVDKNDDIYIAGYRYQDGSEGPSNWLIKKFNRSGYEYTAAEGWNKTFDGNEDRDEAKAIYSDSDGNVYVVGFAENLTGKYDGHEDWWIKKFNSSGYEYSAAEGWNKSFDTNYGGDVATSVYIDQNQDVYVAGYGKNLTNTDSGDWWIKKFNSTGYEFTTAEGWNKTYDFGGEFDDVGSVYIDSSGDIYIAGDGNNYSHEGSFSGDWVIKKFNSSGYEYTSAEGWNKTFDFEENHDVAKSVYVDTDDNVYVAGFGSNITPGGSGVYWGDWVIKKFNSSGYEYTSAEGWNKTFDGERQNDEAQFIYGDDNGIYVLGDFINLSGDYLSSGKLKKFDSTGYEYSTEEGWNISISGDDDFMPYSLSTDSDGDIYVVGSALGLVGGYDYDIFVKKFKGNDDQERYDVAPDMGSFISYNMAGVSSPNNLPSISEPTFSGETHYSTDNIHCNATPTDAENETLTVEWFWYNGTELMFSGNSSGLSNGTNAIITSLGPGNTTKGETWNCTVRSFDGTDYSEYKSAEITIQNVPPTINLLTPTNANTSIRQRTPEFTWSGSDDDGDTLNYTIWVSENSDLSSPNITAQTQDQNYTATSDLELDTQYFWKVEVYDGESRTNSSTWNFTTESYIEVKFINESISFGSMNLSETKNTTSDDPYPFVLQNMGNVLVNVTFGVTGAFWDSSLAPLDTRFLQFKADERTEANSFDYAQSQTTWMNLSTENKTLVKDLNYSDSNDEVVVDILIRVPEDEPAGSKSTNFVIEIP